MRMHASSGSRLTPESAPSNEGTGASRGHQRAIAGVVALGIVALGVAFRLRLGGESLTRSLDDLAQLGASASAALLALVAARRSTGRPRLAWAAIGVGASGWAAGQALWCYDELVAHRLTPFPSLCDFGYLIFPVGAALSLWIMPSIHDRYARRRWLLDGAVVACALVAVSWATTLGAVARSGGDSRFAFAVSLAYPIADIVILTMALADAEAHRWRVDSSRKLLVIMAIAAMAVSDSSFSYYNGIGTYRTGSICDVGWVASFALVALAAGSAIASPATVAEAVRKPRDGASATMLPYVPMLAAAVIIALQRIHHTPFGPVEPIALTAAFCLTLFRQYLTLRENKALLRTVAAREDQLVRQAYYDGLTGLANRALFLDRAEQALQLHKRERRPLAVLFCDLDDFKAVNDTLGHAAGDQLLITASARLRRVLRSVDTAARLGGDEFAVLLQEGGDPHGVGRRIVDSLAAPTSVESRILTNQVSVGVAVVTADEPTPSLDELLAKADQAMYAAKRSGKGRMAVFDDCMTLPSARDFDLRVNLGPAIAAGAIGVAYQPIVHVESGELRGFEALARWEHEGSDVPADEFIPVAAKAGLLDRLTDGVIEHASRQLAEWSRELDRHDLYVSVNLPPSMLTDPEFVSRMASVVDRAGLRRGQLVLEISEDALLRATEAVTKAAWQLRDVGVYLSLDDLGTAYTSLRHLRQVPLHSVKIDRSFVADVDTDRESAQFASSILGLGRDLGLEVVAEGVERSEQENVLTQLGFTLAQGFRYGRAVHASEMDASRLGRTSDREALPDQPARRRRQVPPRSVRHAHPSTADWGSA